MGKTYTSEEVIEFILEERNRCLKICDDHTWWYQRRINEFHNSLTKSYEEGKDASRRIKICVSDISPLMDDRTDIERIRELYKL